SIPFSTAWPSRMCARGWSPASIGRPPCRRPPSATVSTWCCAVATPRPWSGHEGATMSLQATPSQTFGPFFHIGLPALPVTLPAGAQPITLIGRVLDGDGNPVADAFIETWQADLSGRYPEPSASGAPPPVQSMLVGLGRTPTDAEGRFRIRTYRPGPVAAPG